MNKIQSSDQLLGAYASSRVTRPPIGATVLGVILALMTTTLSAQEYASWTASGGGVSGSGGGTFTASAIMPDFTWTSVASLAGGGLVETSATFSGTVGIETVYGEANSEDNLRIGSADNTVSDGSPINATNTVTITFASATPASGWAFSLLDLDDDQVLVSATDSSNNPVSTAVINSWFEGLFDPDPFDSGIDTAFWDVTGVPANTGVLVGNLLTGGQWTGLAGIPPGDNEAAAAWFSPNISLNSLILTFQPIDNEPGNGSTMHVYIASAHGVFADYGDAPQSYDGNANAAARHTPSSDLYLGVVQADSEAAPPPWAPALGLPDGDDDDAEGDDEDGVDTSSLQTINQVGDVFAALLDITGVINNTGSDAQLVCWIDFDEDGTFSDTSGNNGTGSPNERSHPELVAHTLIGSGGGGTESVTNSITSSPFDNSCINRTFNVTSSNSIADVTITVDIDHTWRSDLDITLTSPNSTAVNLTSDNGGSTNNLYVTFDDAAATSITADNSSHTINVLRRPEGILSAFDGENPSGTWTLQICDDTSQDSGVFNSATLDVTTTGGGSVPCSQSGITDSTYTTGNVPAGCSGSTQMLWTNIPSVPTSGNIYSRCRITTDTSFFSDASPSAIGAASDGEVEDDELPVGPTAVTIGDVGLESLSVEEYLASESLDQLRALLVSYGMNVEGMDRAALIASLIEFLDPDGDGQVVLFRWNTLEERGTIGFYVERKAEDQDDWTRINNELLPGLITAPMGGEYWLLDPEAQSGRRYQYRLIELDATGDTRTYGPYTLQIP